MTPLVSVIIPCFNPEKFIAQTLNSVLQQTYKSLEILIIDDHSTDNSYAIAQNFAKEHPQIVKVLKNESKGACAARNMGFQHSKGAYIQYLDADDLLSPQKIEKQVTSLIDYPDSIAVCATWNFTDNINNATNTDAPYLFSTDQACDFFINLWGGNKKEPNMVQTSAWLTPRTLIEKNGSWNISLSKDQDGEFFARIALNSNGIKFVPDIKNFYRKHIYGGNIASLKKKQHLESNLLATQLKEQYLFTQTQSDKAKYAIATQYKHVAIEAWPNFKDISNVALKKCNELGGSNYSPILGGKVIETIKKLCGWKSAKSFSYYIHKLL
ncbi:glycosyltransferase family 2 protein [Saccharicrinis sp. 156]|uniref:glycosyltransferase family 2 protein n=1 Tax=Saccharicrinis sp. 156 TaxID=3417574 RepID=UPI003D34D9C5